MADFELHLDPALLDELLNSPDGPVGAIIEEVSEKAALIARAAAPVMRRRRFSLIHQYGPPGVTKASVHWSGFRFNGAGQIYSGVNVNYGPTLFLEKPARQVTPEVYAFMTTALDEVEL